MPRTVRMNLMTVAEQSQHQSVGLANLWTLPQTITEQVHDISDFGTMSSVRSTVTETVPLSEGQDTGKQHESRRLPKKPWSKAEVAAVMRYFRNHTSKGKLATKNECSHCKLVEDPVLEQ